MSLPLFIQDRIVRQRPGKSEGGRRVIYWMQQAQRLVYNPALSYAAHQAESLGKALDVYFILFPDFAPAQRWHYKFMLQGLAETGRKLKEHGIALRILAAETCEPILQAAVEAHSLVLDMAYLKDQVKMRNSIFQDTKLQCEITEIDSEAVVPVHLASSKEEYSAATLRRKILPQINNFVTIDLPALPKFKPGKTPPKTEFEYGGSFEDDKELWDWAKLRINVAESQGPAKQVTGAHSCALKSLDTFISTKLSNYASLRNHPNLDIQSHLSAYLHFGQISPIEILRRIVESRQIPITSVPALISDKAHLSGMHQNVAAFAEELVVRRELAMNFCLYNPDYESSASLPDWAKSSLADHLHDPREADYPIERLELAETDDVYWNAAQMELLKSGKMHNYMRMYWGKRILAWCPSVEDAYDILAYLNNKYEMDGRDPNGWAGIAWCFGKHDRPWANRAIYGMVRYMNAAGLNRKFEMQAYLKKWSQA
jgi:deoxyribodipyrimidine photo-lyase